MKAAMIGVGKLGYPVALTWALNHEMIGYDVFSTAKEITQSRKYPHLEPGCQRLLDRGVMLPIVDSIDEAVAHADIVFIAVQTPHGGDYEGITRMPDTREDFDYTSLKVAVGDVARSAERQQKHVTIVVISTVLPGTSNREVLPLLVGNKFVSYVYAPMFIAQGTVVEDARRPEFVLLGIDRSDARGVEDVKAFFKEMHPVEKLRFMGVASAELTKVAYNVFLGLKICAANSVMEIAHKTGANCDDVTDALAMATDRVVSSKYMRGGMGDGGGCHPRDQIALSWLAEEIDLSYDLFGSMVKSREYQTEWLADLCIDEAVNAEDAMPIVILGKAFKKGTNLTIGSPAILLKNILSEMYAEVYQWDPYVDDETCAFMKPSVFVIATDHDEFYSMIFSKGSVIIDPWGKMKDMDGVKVVRVGRK